LTISQPNQVPNYKNEDFMEVWKQMSVLNKFHTWLITKTANYQSYVSLEPMSRFCSEWFAL